MTPRSIRRAAERKANKLARKAAQLALPAAADPAELFTQEIPALNPSPAEAPETPAAPVILAAPAANAHITAIASALTGQSTLLPTADAAHFEQLLRDHHNAYQPVGLQESNLVQSLAETTWRARRTLALEMALFARGRIEFAAQFAEHNPDLRESMIDLHTFLTYEKQIRGLQLQEARLSRRSEKASAELRRLQTERRDREEQVRRQQQRERQTQIAAAAELYQAAQKRNQVFDPQQNGFEFSNREIESYLAHKEHVKAHFAAALNLPMRAQAA